MKISTYLFHIPHPVSWLYVLLTTTMCVFAGCATQIPVEVQTADSAGATTEQPYAAAEALPVVRAGRYTLIEIDSASHRDILNQIIDVTVPVSTQKQTTTVADAMKYVMLQSGYQLCDTPDIIAFQNFTLPTAHQHLGPMTLKDALRILAGPGWTMQVDHFNRTVCFIPKEVQKDHIDPASHQESQP